MNTSAIGSSVRESGLTDTGDRAGPVDLVYLWCDGADPVFRAKRAACAARFGIPLNDDLNGDARVLSNDELRYSLRSAEL